MIIYDVPQTFPEESFQSNAITLSIAQYFQFNQEPECGDCRKYFLPFEDDDTFYFQFNDEVTSVVLLDETDDTPVVTTGVTIDGNQFSIDFSQIPEETQCFYITVNDTCKIQHGYQRASCHDTILIEGLYDVGRTDLVGNYYENGYSNNIRFYGNLEWTAEESEEESVNDVTISVKAISVYQLRIEQLLPNGSWALRQLAKSALRGKLIYVTYKGTRYIYDIFNDSIEKGNDTSDKWLPVITLKTVEQERDFVC